jgi:CelD/BcsL family acetyltransferase involved in cellulose biosynthesis
METSILRTPDLFAALAPEWNAVLRASLADTPFLTLEWQQTWWNCLGEGELFVITVRDGGALVGLAPLFILPQPDKAVQVRRLLRLIGSVDASDYLDLIAVHGLIEDAIGRGCTEFDFLRGDEEYKYRLGAKDTWIYHLTLLKE